MEQRLNLWDIVRSSTSPCAVSISQFFYTRYGDSVFCAFSDLRNVNDFRTDASDTSSDVDVVLEACSSDTTWLCDSLDDMDYRSRHLRKEEILHSLYLIPFHLRPEYGTRSLRACRTPLLLHIRSRISYLLSLSFHSFSFRFYLSIMIGH